MDDCPSTPRVRSGVTCWRRSGKPTERVYGDEQLDRLARRVMADSAGIPLLVVALLHAVAAGFEPSDAQPPRSEEHTSELQSQSNLVCRLLLEKKKIAKTRRSARASTGLPS